MNRILDKQIKQAFGSLKTIPKDMQTFLELVGKTYDARDEDRLLTERSFEISSKELSELNQRMQTESKAMKASLAELERLNKLMINRELKMIELKSEIASLKEQLAAKASR